MTHKRHIDRRAFVGGLALAGAAAALPQAAVTASAGAPDEWDHSWLRRLTHKHRAFFDTRSYSSEIFGYPARYRAAMIDGYGARDRDIQVVVGLHGGAWLTGIDDARWASLELGAFGNIDDPTTNARAVRNPMRAAVGGAPANTVESAQQQGVTVLLCNNTLRRMSRDLATRRNSTPDAVYAEIRQGVLPGVIVVPAMVAAVGLAQERGASYLING